MPGCPPGRSGRPASSGPGTGRPPTALADAAVSERGPAGQHFRVLFPPSSAPHPARTASRERGRRAAGLARIARDGDAPGPGTVRTTQASRRRGTGFRQGSRRRRQGLQRACRHMRRARHSGLSTGVAPTAWRYDAICYKKHTQTRAAPGGLTRCSRSACHAVISALHPAACRRHPADAGRADCVRDGQHSLEPGLPAGDPVAAGRNRHQ